MNIALVTDSTACLPRYRVEQTGLTVVPVQVVIGDQVYDEGVAINSTAVVGAIRGGAEVTTSRPSPERFAEVYRNLAKQGVEEIVSIHLSSELSGTYSAAVLAARESEIPVRVVDTRSVGLGLGFAVMEAASALRKGEDGAHVADAAGRAGHLSQVWLTVESLESLRKGGRIGLAQAAVGTALAIKPILQVVGGRVVQIEKVRTSARASTRLVELVVQAAGGLSHTWQVGVQHAGSPDRAAALAKDLGKALPGVPVVTTDLGAVLTAHAGPGAIAVVLSPMH